MGLCAARGLLAGAGALALLIATGACGGGDDGEGGGGGGGTDGGAAEVIGPAGGSVVIAGAELVIPAGALDDEVEIAIEVTTEVAPDGFLADSPVFRFEPDGLIFSAPASARIEFAGDPSGVDLIWSNAAADGFDAMGGAIDGSSVVGAVTHFSRGFAGRVDDGGGSDDCGGLCAPGQVCVAGQCVADGGGDPAACSDGVDNDDDDTTDGADSGCFLPDDDSEEIDCTDGIDNDGDGLIDYPPATAVPLATDPGCYNALDGSERPGCSDGKDNDGDGAIDLADSHCLNADQHFEAPAD